MPATVVNVGKSRWQKGITLYAGRGNGGKSTIDNTEPGKEGWLGNPFRLEQFDRETSIALYCRVFERKLKDKRFRRELEKYVGKDITIGCFCKPQPCHADVIASWLNSQAKSTVKPKMQGVQAILGDCRDLIPEHGPYDLLFADPPFNIGKSYPGYEDRSSQKMYDEFTTTWISLAWENTTGIMAIHGNDELCETYLLTTRALGMKKHRLAWVNWHYRFGECGRSNWIDSRCHLLIFAKDPKNYTWNPDDVLVQSDRVDYGDKRIHDSPRGGKRLPFNVWGVPSDGDYWGRVQGNNGEAKFRHPDQSNQLPEVYMERLIQAYSNRGDKCCDPFCGTGTFAVVCQALNRNCVTFDISGENINSTRKRLKHGAVRIKG